MRAGGASASLVEYITSFSVVMIAAVLALTPAAVIGLICGIILLAFALIARTLERKKYEMYE